MKQEDINKLSKTDIQEKILELTALLEKMKLSHAVSGLENPLKIRITRRSIARLKTTLYKK